MIKIILILIMVCVLLLPAQALANDGGGLMLDDKGMLKIEITPLSSSVEIRGDFEFEVAFTNNTSDEIILNDINRIFSGQYIQLTFVGNLGFSYEDCKIPAGQETKLTIKTTVPYDIEWYKDNDNDNYYTNLDLSINYTVFEYITEQGEDMDSYYGHDNSQLKTYPLIISNIKDGSEFLNLQIINDKTEYEIIENYDWVDEYTAFISHTLTVKNIGTSVIENLYFQDYSGVFGSYGLFEIAAQSSKDFDLDTRYYLNENEINETITAEYKLLFQINHYYYATSISKEYSTKIISFPELTYSYISETVGDTEKNYLVFTNSSETKYSNLYAFFASNSNFESIVSEYKSIEIKAKGKISLMLREEIQGRNRLYIGYKENEIIYLWTIYIYDNNKNFTYDFYRKVLPTSNQSSYHSSSSTPLPTAKPTYYDSPKSTTPIPTPTASPTIEITDVKKSSSIPIWVWIILPAAIVCAGLIVFLIRKKSKSEDE